MSTIDGELLYYLARTKLDETAHKEIGNELAYYAQKGKMSCVIKLTKKQQDIFETFKNLQIFYKEKGIKVEKYDSSVGPILITNDLDGDLLFSWSPDIEK